MKTTFLRFILPFATVAALASESFAKFHDHLGIQMWSLREVAKESPVKALDLAKSYGFVEIEAGKPNNMPLDEYVAAIKERGLKVVGIHAGYDLLAKNVDEAIATAKAFGATYITCPWAQPGGKPWSMEAVQEIAATFNKAGKAIKAAGLQLGYHPHGYEFLPSGGPEGETVFDVFVRETDPNLVKLQMDVFWVFHAGQDPVTLMKKYGDRWFSLHVKDIRQGAITHLATGKAPPTDNVAVGTGQIDWKSVLTTAEKVGVKYYFIEDETPAPLQAIPASVAYLKALKL